MTLDRQNTPSYREEDKEDPMQGNHCDLPAIVLCCTYERRRWQQPHESLASLTNATYQLPQSVALMSEICETLF